MILYVCNIEIGLVLGRVIECMDVFYSYGMNYFFIIKVEEIINFLLFF